MENMDIEWAYHNLREDEFTRFMDEKEHFNEMDQIIAGVTLIQALRDQNFDAARCLLSHPVNVNVHDLDDGITALMLSYDGEIEIVKMLLDQGADIEAADSRGMTPLMHAIHWGMFQVALFLIQQGAELNQYDDYNINALMLMAFNRFEMDHDDEITDKVFMQVLELMINSGAEINNKNNDGESALLLALDDQMDLRIVKLLLENGADPNVESSLGETPLNLAVRKNHSEVLIDLLNFGADLHYKNKDGMSALDYAELLTDKTCFNILEEWSKSK